MLIPIEEQVRQYDALRTQSKTIKTEMDRLANAIKQYAEYHGSKDDKGSFFCESDDFIFGQQARKSITFKQEESVEFLSRRGYTNAITIIKVVNEPEIEKLIGEGKITYDDLEHMTETKMSYAILVEPKEQVAEVQQEEIKLPRVAMSKSKFMRVK